MTDHACYGCLDVLGPRRNDHHDVLFTDSRTGRGYCHECVVVLATWEMDGRPEADDPDCYYLEWIGEDVPAGVAAPEGDDRAD